MGLTMSQAFPPETLRGYAPPNVRQFSVFLDNKVGKLLPLVEMFDDAENVHLCSLSVQESSDYGVVRVIANNAQAARELLRKQGLSFSELDLLVVELCGTHTLTSLCLCLLGAELNIRFAYPLMLAQNEETIFALAVDDLFLAGQVLRKRNFRLLGEADLP